MTECPECGRAIPRANLIEGEIFPCPDCGTELEVTAIEPFRVAAAPREEEDWGE
jgi:alpha-aminoadipate/glutamate carrier protein LysW